MSALPLHYFGNLKKKLKKMDNLLMKILSNDLLMSSIREHLPEKDFNTLCCAMFCFSPNHPPQPNKFDKCFLADDGIICIGNHFEH